MPAADHDILRLGLIIRYRTLLLDNHTLWLGSGTVLNCRALRLDTHNRITVTGNLLLALQGGGTLLLQQQLAFTGRDLKLPLALLLLTLGCQPLLLLQLLLFQGCLATHLCHLLALQGFQPRGTLTLGLQQGLFALPGLQLQLLLLYQLLPVDRRGASTATAHPHHLLRMCGPAVQTGTFQHAPAIVADAGTVAVSNWLVITAATPAIHPDIRDPDNRPLLIGLHGAHVLDTTRPGLCLRGCDQPETYSDNDFFHDAVSK